MTKAPKKRKRSKLTILLLAPIMAFTFIIGWSLYWIGNTKLKQKHSTDPKIRTDHDPIQLMVIPNQEEKAITNN
jgi:hypothetical protein